MVKESTYINDASVTSRGHQLGSQIVMNLGKMLISAGREGSPRHNLIPNASKRCQEITAAENEFGLTDPRGVDRICDNVVFEEVRPGLGSRG